MGLQYGERAGKDIAFNFDSIWENMMHTDGELWKQGKTANEKVEYCVAYIERSMRELSFLAPELIEFFEGIAQGATLELDKCRYAGLCSHFVKLGILNWSHFPFHPNWDFRLDRPLGTKADESVKTGGKPEGHDCNAFWVKGDATKTKDAFAVRAVQHWSVERLWSFYSRQVAYVAIPEDSKARVFWGHSNAGNLGGLGGGLLNDMGLCALPAGCSYSSEHWNQVDDTCAPGIKDFILASYGVIFSKSPEEAAERITTGTREYRKLTGRKTVLRARGANIVFANAEKAICVEQTARHHPIRRPGDLAEKGNDYIVIANHFKCSGSFDENNCFDDENRMTRYEPEKEKSDDTFGTYFRFWSAIWMIRNNYGQIDRERLLEDFSASHIGYDRQGNRYDPDPQTGPPTVPGTFCCHMLPFTIENPLGVGGNIETAVFNLSTLEVWWVPVWPCHYKVYDMNWDYLNLRPFSEYRRMLRG
jgi:hypothetical protein